MTIARVGKQTREVRGQFREITCLHGSAVARAETSRRTGRSHIGRSDALNRAKAASCCRVALAFGRRPDRGKYTSPRASCDHRKTSSLQGVWQRKARLSMSCCASWSATVWEKTLRDNAPANLFREEGLIRQLKTSVTAKPPGCRTMLPREPRLPIPLPVQSHRLRFLPRPVSSTGDGLPFEVDRRWPKRNIGVWRTARRPLPS